jgi:branched-chain amino acid transport system permease protein
VLQIIYIHVMIAPMHFINTIIVPGITAGAVYALIAIGFTVLFRTTGVLNFAQGEMVMLGPTAVLVLHETWGLPLWIGFVGAVFVVCAFALIEERVAVRPFLQSGTQVPWILSTLGASVILAELLTIPFRGEGRAFPYGASTAPHRILGIQLSPTDMIMIATPIVLVGLLHLFYTRTRLGLMTQAVAEDPDGASAIGVSKKRMSQLSAVLAGLVALITGLVLAPTQLVNPTLGITYLFNGFVGAAIGGLGSLTGALVGCLVVGVLGQLSSNYIGSLYVNATLFGVLLLIYIARPHGIFGRPAVRAA